MTLLRSIVHVEIENMKSLYSKRWLSGRCKICFRLIARMVCLFWSEDGNCSYIKCDSTLRKLLWESTPSLELQGLCEQVLLSTDL